MGLNTYLKPLHKAYQIGTKNMLSLEKWKKRRGEKKRREERITRIEMNCMSNQTIKLRLTLFSLIFSFSLCFLFISFPLIYSIQTWAKCNPIFEFGTLLTFHLSFDWDLLMGAYFFHYKINKIDPLIGEPRT